MAFNRGRDALRECESRLRALVAEAAAVGDYDAVLQLTEWARRVAALETVRPPAGGLGKACNHAGHEEGDDADHLSPSAPSPGKKSIRRRKKGRAPRQRAAAVYPKFARVDDQLVKIGWSKKAKKEYLHKAPRRVVDALVARFVKLGAGREICSTDQVFPLRDEDSDIPSYQAYLCLAWLRSIGLVQQHGRRGYSISKGTDARIVIRALWSELPVMRS
jgi:hypothetical protein